ncbi:hypothetical protein [Streptomyces sp. NPDC018000]|uniref:hypothetical protein n=1 Tax=Streptomyces sp. NPDC018000 TaxID=3365028 RepID=UPI00379E6019
MVSDTTCSPWRGVPRPVFGFLHACWAFSLTVLFVRQARGSAQSAVVPFLDAYLRKQQTCFAAATESLARALAYVSADVVRGHISRAVSEVVG